MSRGLCCWPGHGWLGSRHGSAAQSPASGAAGTSRSGLQQRQRDSLARSISSCCPSASARLASSHQPLLVPAPAKPPQRSRPTPALLGTSPCHPQHCHRPPIPPKWCQGRSHAIPCIVPSFVAKRYLCQELSATACSSTARPMGPHRRPSRPAASPRPYPGEVSSATVSIALLSCRVSQSFTSRSRICRDTDMVAVGTGAAWPPLWHHLPPHPACLCPQHGPGHLTRQPPATQKALGPPAQAPQGAGLGHPGSARVTFPARTVPG